MRRLVDLVKLSRLDKLIRRRATGSPAELAERLDLSRSSLFEIIAFLKEEMRAPIVYDRSRPSYMYSYEPRFYLGFEHERIKSSEMLTVSGGNDSSEKRNNKIDADEDNFIIDEDINFNDLYFD